MRRNLIGAVCLAMTAALALGAAPAPAEAAELKLEAQLVWGTDDSKPPAGKTWKPVEPALKKKIPLKWTNYFEVNRKAFAVATGEMAKVPMSEKCQIEVKNVDNSTVEVLLVGKGKEVMRRKQVLPKGEILVLGGNAPNDTAWLVILRRAE